MAAAARATVILVVLLIAIIGCNIAPSARAQAPPTVQQLRAEVVKMKRQMSVNKVIWNKYSIFVKSLDGILNASFSGQQQLSGATLLVPTNSAVTRMFAKVKPTEANKPRLANVAKFHILTRRYTFAQLVALPTGSKGAIPTLQGARAQRYMLGGSPQTVMIGKQGLMRFQVPVSASRIVDKTLYQGPYFTVQGVDKVMTSSFYSG